LCNRERLNDFLKGVEIPEEAASLVRTIADSPMAFFYLLFARCCHSFKKRLRLLTPGDLRLYKREEKSGV